MPEPKWVMAVGDCAVDGGVFKGSYAVRGGIGGALPVDLLVRGCPPPPAEILAGLLHLLAANRDRPSRRGLRRPGYSRHSSRSSRARAGGSAASGEPARQVLRRVLAAQVAPALERLDRPAATGPAPGRAGWRRRRVPSARQARLDAVTRWRSSIAPAITQ